MKKLFDKIKIKVINFFKWVWSECKDWHTLVLLAVVCLVLGLPVWLGVLLGFLFSWEWAFWVAGIFWGFWMLPGAPFFALSVSVTLGIKKIFEKATERKAKKQENNEADAQPVENDTDKKDPD